MTAKKYQRGKQIKSIHAFLDAINSKGFVMVRGKVYHKEWAMSWTIRATMRHINGGMVFHAERI